MTNTKLIAIFALASEGVELLIDDKEEVISLIRTHQGRMRQAPKIFNTSTTNALTDSKEAFRREVEDIFSITSRSMMRDFIQSDQGDARTWGR